VSAQRSRARLLLKDVAMSRPIRLSALLLAAAVMAAPAIVAAQTASLNVEIDQARRVQLRGAAASVIVGNPAIADVTVVDANTLYITGKGYGVTEVVAVDPIGRTVFQSQVVVTAGDGGGRVRVWRGAQATEMACGNSCSPSVRNGDAAATPTP
jgi:Flp pilus assembly secretin CpaC